MEHEMKTQTRHKQSAGFTLIEIMVVVIVIGILAATIIPQFMNTAQDAKISKAKSDVAEIEGALERFNVHMDRYPTSEESLKALVEAPTGAEKDWRGPYLNMVRSDPWGHQYQYRVPGHTTPRVSTSGRRARTARTAAKGQIRGHRELAGRLQL